MKSTFIHNIKLIFILINDRIYSVIDNKISMIGGFIMGFGRIGFPELILILAISLVIFGPSKLPEIGKSLGKALNEFKSGASGDNDKKDDSVNGNK